MGDGRSIKLWYDAWVGGDGTGKLISPIRILDPNATVDVLIDNEHNTWKMDTISEIFLPVDRERIMQILISTYGLTREFGSLVKTDSSEFGICTL